MVKINDNFYISKENVVLAAEGKEGYYIILTSGVKVDVTEEVFLEIIA